MSESDSPNNDTPHLQSLLNRLGSLAVGATFLAGTQAQVMSISIGLIGDQETGAIRAANALFLSGLILDLMAAFLSYLTSRWLQMLSGTEKAHLEKTFGSHQDRRERGSRHVENGDSGRWKEQEVEAPVKSRKKQHLNDKIVGLCFATSLIISMPLLAFGSLCMVAGILVYTWSQHPTVVAAIATGTFVLNLPFLAGVLLISRKSSRRMTMIDHLGKLQGYW